MTCRPHRREVRGACSCAIVPLLLIASSALLAQIRPLPADKQMLWLSYSGDHAVGGKFGLHLDGGFRLMNDAGWQQWLVRPGVNYALTRSVQISAAYAYFKTYPGGMGLVAGSSPEHRLHQQIQVFQPMGKLVLKHRGRIEQRFLGSGFADARERGWNLQNRFRYMARTDIPLVKTMGERTTIYLGLYNEVMFRAGGVAPGGFDQNRAYAGVGFRPSTTCAFEVGVFNQRFRPQAGRLESNFVLLTTFSTSAALRRK